MTGEEEPFFEMVSDVHCMPLKSRNKDTQNQMCKENPIFMRGLLSFVVSENRDRRKVDGESV